MAKGVDIPEDCLEAYSSFHNHTSASPKFIVFRLTDDFFSSALEHVAAPTASFSTMVEQLPKEHCRWILYSLDPSESPLLQEKALSRTLCFISWSPEDAPIKQKMLYSASKGLFRSALPGGTDLLLVQATSLDEITLKIVVERVLERQSAE